MIFALLTVAYGWESTCDGIPFCRRQHDIIGCRKLRAADFLYAWKADIV